MTWKKATAAEHHTGNRCATCNDAMPSDYSSRLGAAPPAPVHCDGSRIGWQKGGVPIPHHGRTAYTCWKCQQSLGCDQCAGAVTEVLCRACVVWGTHAAFAKHGPILNTPEMLAKRGYRRAPEFGDYPADYQLVYRATEGKGGLSVGKLQRLVAQVLANAKRAEQPPEPAPGDWWQR